MRLFVLISRTVFLVAFAVVLLVAVLARCPCAIFERATTVQLACSGRSSASQAQGIAPLSRGIAAIPA
jgi:hypothetical protein